MTLFRKNYKDAFNDIKPSEAFVNSVIEKASGKRPPAYKRYAKYAAPLAAAVIIVSAAAVSMPIWQRADNTEPEKIAEVIDEPASTKSPAETPIAVTPSENTSDRSYSAPVAQSVREDANVAAGSAKTDTVPPAAVRSESAPEKPSQTEAMQSEEVQAETTHTETAQTEAAEEKTEKNAVLGDTDEELRVMSEPMDMAPYSAAYDASEEPSAKSEPVEDADIPTPSGYTCTSATPRGYTFVNDAGAVITVTISYGGEECAPYIEEDGENIYAVFTSFGLSVTINASGADRSSVEEIINSLR